LNDRPDFSADAPDVQLRAEKKLGVSETAFPEPGANLDIPDFLKR
jgi:hypothetical protein